MPEHKPKFERTETEQPESDRDRLVSYEVEDTTVICDRMNPRAWIKSDVVSELEQ